ncbi:MAG: hypothetical protein AB1405_02030 [Bdellovibrionota bacterium]
MKPRSPRNSFLASILAFCAAFGVVRCGSELLSFLSMGAGALALLAGQADRIQSTASNVCFDEGDNCNGVLGDIGGNADDDTIALAKAIMNPVAGDPTFTVGADDQALGWFSSAQAAFDDIVAVDGTEGVDLPDLEEGETALINIQTDDPTGDTADNFLGCTGKVYEIQETYVRIGFDGADYTLEQTYRQVGYIVFEDCVLTGDWLDDSDSSERITFVSGSIKYDNNIGDGYERVSGSFQVKFDADINAGTAGFWGTGAGGQDTTVTATIDARRAGGVTSGQGLCFTGTAVPCVPAALLVPFGPGAFQRN